MHYLQIVIYIYKTSKKTHVPSFQNQRSSADSIGQTKAVRRKWPKWHTHRGLKAFQADNHWPTRWRWAFRTPMDTRNWLTVGRETLRFVFELNLFKGRYLNIGIILCSSQNLRWPTCREQIIQCYQWYKIHRKMGEAKYKGMTRTFKNTITKNTYPTSYHSNGQQRVVPKKMNTLKRQLVLLVFSQGTRMRSLFWMRLHRLAQQKQTSIRESINTQDFLIAKVHWNRLKQAENLGVKMNQSPEGVAKAKIWPYPKSSCEPFFCWDLGAFGASLLSRLERSGP